MTTNHDSGHAINVANMEDLISFINGDGGTYNPSNNSIKLNQLQTLLLNSKSALQMMKNTKTAYDNSTNAREISFAPLKKNATRIMAALEASGAVQQTIDDARTINHKIQGTHHHKTTTDTTAAPAQPAADNTAVPPVVHHSTAQQSYDYQIDNFGKLVVLLTNEPLYSPNETDLNVPGLNTTLANMQSTNTNVINAYTDISNARINRYTVLYADNTGLVDIAYAVKQYVKSVYGATSPQYKQLTGLIFKKIQA